MAVTITPEQHARTNAINDLMPGAVVELGHPPDLDGVIRLDCHSGRRSWSVWVTPDGRAWPIEPASAGWRASS